MEEITVSDNNMTDSDGKSVTSASKTIENELREHLNRVDNEYRDEEIKKDIPNAENIKPFVVPGFVLDFLQDKPIKIQEIIINSNLSPDQKEKIKHVFLPNENELSINREAMREILGDLCMTYPEIQPYFSSKTIFFGTFLFGFFERKSMAESILAV